MNSFQDLLNVEREFEDLGLAAAEGKVGFHNVPAGGEPYRGAAHRFVVEEPRDRGNGLGLAFYERKRKVAAGGINSAPGVGNHVVVEHVGGHRSKQAHLIAGVGNAGQLHDGFHAVPAGGREAVPAGSAGEGPLGAFIVETAVVAGRDHVEARVRAVLVDGVVLAPVAPERFGRHVDVAGVAPYGHLAR